MIEETSKAKFLRQGTWMLATTLLGGIFMFAVHVFSPLLGEKEYGLFGTLLGMINLVTMPFLGLQTLFTQDAAAALTADSRARLAGTARALLLINFLIWVAVAVVVVLCQKQILDIFSITNPMALWLVLGMGLIAVGGPIFNGILVGLQNFLWAGWSQILNGAGRFVAIGVVVGFCGAKATGAVAGAVVGAFLALVVAVYHSRNVWLARDTLPCRWREWLAQAVPLTFALGAFQFLLTADMVIVRAILGENQTGYYSAAGMLARGMVSFTAPLISVMFPKIVQSVAAGRSTNVLFMTVVCSTGLGVFAATCCSATGMALQYLVSHREWAMCFAGNGCRKT